MAAEPGPVLSNHSDTAFQPGCPHGMTMAVVTAAHLPLVLLICSSGTSAFTLTPMYYPSKNSFPAQRGTISFCWLQSRIPPNGGKKIQKNLLKLETLMSKGGEAVAKKEVLGFGKVKIRFLMKLAENNDFNNPC